MEKRVPGVIGQKAGVDTAFYRAVHNEEKIVELLMRSDISVYVKLKRKGVGTVKVGKHRKNLERKSNANPCVDLRVVRNSSLYPDFLTAIILPAPNLQVHLSSRVFAPPSLDRTDHFVGAAHIAGTSVGASAFTHSRRAFVRPAAIASAAPARLILEEPDGSWHPDGPTREHVRRTVRCLGHHFEALHRSNVTRPPPERRAAEGLRCTFSSRPTRC
jgi:hypothetical protein